MSFFICRRCLFHDSVICVLKLQHWRYFLNDSFSQKLEAPEQCFRVPGIVGSWNYIIFSRIETSTDGKRRRAEVWDRLRMHILKVFISEKGILFSNIEPKINWESGQWKRSGSTLFNNCLRTSEGHFEVVDFYENCSLQTFLLYWETAGNSILWSERLMKYLRMMTKWKVHYDIFTN